MMENIDFVNDMMTYGPMGVCLVYFIVKDWKISQEIRAALSDFKCAIELLNERVK